MFRGRYEHNLDAKGRTSIPAKFRELLLEKYNDERWVLTQYDGCIWCYPFAEWERIENRVSELPQFKKEIKALQRIFISAAVECPMDKLGRILLPGILRDYAGLNRELVFVGMSRRIEIWDKEKWHCEMNKALDDSQLQDSIEEVLAKFEV